MTTQKRINALLFDLGGVVINIDFDQALRSWERQSKLSIEDIRCRFVMDTPYEQHERGEIRATEYFKHLRNTLELEGSDEEIARGWNAIFLGEITQTLNDIRMAKTQLPCFAFTNSNPTHQAAWMAAYPQLATAFDNVFVSSDLGLRKPDHAAFYAIAETTGIDLSTLLFFDDTLQNVEGALSAGLQAVHVRTPADVKRKLEGIGVL
ncbi:HAD family phosphatase [Gammaproteobacteria bacterium]|nr:HAD family phosphatase [Gammaproteobacteria bacterium]